MELISNFIKNSWKFTTNFQFDVWLEWIWNNAGLYIVLYIFVFSFLVSLPYFKKTHNSYDDVMGERTALFFVIGFIIPFLPLALYIALGLTVSITLGIYLPVLIAETFPTKVVPLVRRIFTS